MTTQKETTNNPTAIFQMIENEIMPRFFFITNLSIIRYTKEPEINLILVISEHIKENKLRITGRMRYEHTKRKTIFQIKKDFKTLTQAKKEISNLYTDLLKNTPLKEVSTPQTLTFNKKETIQKILDKIQKSNLFDVTQNPITK